MSAADNFRSYFDPEGRYRNGQGEIPVVFATRGGGRFPGKLCFKGGLCVRAEMERGGDWGMPDESPLQGVRFLLQFDDKLAGVAIDQGRVIHLDDTPTRSSKRDFLANFRIARNLFVHPRVSSDSPAIDTAAVERTLARAAIWLTPKSVAGFNSADFPELGPDRQRELESSVHSLLAVANEVPADKSPTTEQYGKAQTAFLRILDILDPYLAMPDEARAIEVALRTVTFPAWVVNWDYELSTDSDGVHAVWVNVFADEQAVPRSELGRTATELTTRIRQAFQPAKIERWPYVRLKTGMEHKVG